MSKEERKYEIAEKETMGIFDQHELDITGLSNTMDIYAKEVAIEFAEWVEDNSYTKGKGDKGWYQYYQKIEDLPHGVALSYPVYEFITIEQMFQLFIQSKKL